MTAPALPLNWTCPTCGGDPTPEERGYGGYHPVCEALAQSKPLLPLGLPKLAPKACHYCDRPMPARSLDNMHAACEVMAGQDAQARGYC